TMAKGSVPGRKSCGTSPVLVWISSDGPDAARSSVTSKWKDGSGSKYGRPVNARRWSSVSGDSPPRAKNSSFIRRTSPMSMPAERYRRPQHSRGEPLAHARAARRRDGARDVDMVLGIGGASAAAHAVVARQRRVGVAHD